jgi:hypothetical protein
MYRVSTGKLGDLADFVVDQLQQGNEWAVVEHRYITLRNEEITCFDKLQLAEDFLRETLKYRGASLVPLAKLNAVLGPLNESQTKNEIRLEGFFVELETMLNNYNNEKKELSNLNVNTMNEKNLEALKRNLKYLGFGEGLNEELQKNIEDKRPEFTLHHEVEYNSRKMMSGLSFKAGEQNEMYFFNRYSATLADQPERMQTFNLDRGNGITTKEAFNLLEGRAVNKDLVNKEGQEYNAWLQLDFSKKEENGNYKLNRYHENYNFNFAAEMQKLILKPMNEEQEKQLMQSLQKGNLQSVTFLKEGAEVKMFIEANPRERTINLYDEKMNRLSEEQKADFVELSPRKAQHKEQSVSDDGESGGKQSQKQKNNHDVNAGAGEDDEGPELKKKRTRRQGKGISM